MRLLGSLLGVALLLSLSACDSEEATQEEAAQPPIQTQTPEQTTGSFGRSESQPAPVGEDATEVEDMESQAMPVPAIEARDRAVEEDSPES